MPTSLSTNPPVSDGRSLRSDSLHFPNQRRQTQRLRNPLANQALQMCIRDRNKLSLQNKTKQRLYRPTLPDAILTGKEEFWGEGFCGQSLEQQFVHNVYPMEGHSKVRMFYRNGGSFMGTMTDTSKWVRMYQSSELDFVVNQDCWYGGEARYADIILPACTNLERNDIGEWAAPGGYTTNAQIGLNYRVIVRQQKCVEPLGESKSDYEIFTLLADRLGKKELYTEGNTCLLYTSRCV